MGVVLNKSFPAFDMLSHQDTENVVSYGSFVDSYLEQCSCIWVHGCIPKFVCVHLSKAFKSLKFALVVRPLG